MVFIYLLLEALLHRPFDHGQFAFPHQDHVQRLQALFRVDLPAAMVALGASLASGGLMLALGIPCLRLCRLMLHLIALIFAAFMRLITGGDVTEE